jgi:predicted ABC-type transport system involved in lysophospholipase L1 biosynthesis ATPase subunit
MQQPKQTIKTNQATGAYLTHILDLHNIRKRYNPGTPVETEVLHGIDMALAEAEFVSLTGPSGSGKSTLLNIIGLLERPTTGELTIAGQRADQLDDAALTRLRGAPSVSCSSFTTCCPPSPRWKT